MITSITGSVIALGAGYATFEIGGFGVRVEVPSGSRAPALHVGAIATLNTAFIVREDSLTLYGFQTPDELEVFHLLLTVTGVGPRSAMGVLSTLAPQEIAFAATQEDEKVFRTVSGIGPKTAKLIIISLNGKLEHLARRSDVENATVSQNTNIEQVVAGLVGLGWSEQSSRQAVLQAQDSALTENQSVDAQSLMRNALLMLQSPKVSGR
ncbi:MAG TPA: Holliday junction branch migration protein RuvA [Microbacteriaceae bacterium]|nr:Holliday junction branch migration protein RuvA [Microbacteriaceae bacterium]